MSLFSFKSEGLEYSFELSTTKKDAVPTIQFERLKAIAQNRKRLDDQNAQNENQLEALFDSTDAFWDLLAFDFQKAYPDHWSVENFHPIKGFASSKDRIQFVGFISYEKSLNEITKEIFADGSNDKSVDETDTGKIESKNGENKKRPIAVSQKQSSD